MQRRIIALLGIGAALWSVQPGQAQSTARKGWNGGSGSNRSMFVPNYRPYYKKPTWIAKTTVFQPPANYFPVIVSPHNVPRSTKVYPTRQGAGAYRPIYKPKPYPTVPCYPSNFTALPGGVIWLSPNTRVATPQAIPIANATQLATTTRLDELASERLKQKFAGEVWKRTELYFGSQKPDGSQVSEEAFQAFVDEEITPRFPEGLTLLVGNGQFRNAAGTLVKERASLLILFYPWQLEDADRKIQAIRDAYKRRHQQESVLRVDSLARISF